MAETDADREKSFVFQKKMTDASQQPLELHHLAHDLRGPLNSILGFAELLLEGIEGSLNETQREDIGAIHQSARNLLSLINNVVDLSKLEANRLNLAFEAVDLNQVLQKILAMDFGTGKSTPVEFAVNLADGYPLLWGDRDRLEQMIVSLVRFGFKTKKTEKITIAVDYDATDVTIQLDMAGVVIPPQELGELFELIVKVDAAGRSQLGPGGLELPLIRRLIEKHNGQIWAENEKDTGTAFYFKLPVYNEANRS